jgi:hypothetical protein
MVQRFNGSRFKGSRFKVQRFKVQGFGFKGLGLKLMVFFILALELMVIVNLTALIDAGFHQYCYGF